uniref:Uncharacterized protein n=1 Tax=Anopheles dirus TaxID=7168 RepID=A0A182N8D6_9DIPT
MCAMYREVPLFQQSVVSNKSKSITVSSGGYHAMLLDSKTSEVSGGFRFNDYSDTRPFSHRFIYWRTCQETIYLTEICLNKNDVNYEMKIKFEGSPILSVECYKSSKQPLIMVFVTTTSFHHVSLEIPGSADQLHAEQDSYVHQLNEKLMTDKLHCYAFINDIGQAYPLTACVAHFPDNFCSKIAIAGANSVHLFTLKPEKLKLDVTFVELDYNPLTFSKLIHTLTDTWRKKSHTSQVVTMAFDTRMLADSPQYSFLYTLHRDGALRAWLPCGRCLTTDYLSQYTQGIHTCILRCSRTLLALYFSFQTFSEFVILRPEVAIDSSAGTVSSVVLKKICTVLAPNYDLIDFKLCDQRLWSLWCNAEGETQTLFYKLAARDSADTVKSIWSPVILENTSGKDHSPLEAGMDLKDVYCNLIFQSGLFPDKVITKTLMMFNRNLASISASSTVTKSSMVRLKRYVLTCMESQLQQECASLRQNGLLDEEQIQEMSNRLWEKFYLYCIQYRYESSRPIGLFILHEHCNEATHFVAGVVHKKYVSFFRVCDDIEDAFYAPISQDLFVSDEIFQDTMKNNRETMQLITFLGQIERTLTDEQKHELDSLIHQQQESKDNNLSFAGAVQNQLIVHNLLPAFLQGISDLPGAVKYLLQCVKPVNKNDHLSAWHEDAVSTAYGYYELTCELILTTAKQTIQLRYMLLRNLLLLLHVIQRHCNLHYDVIDAIQSTIRPDTEIMLRCPSSDDFLFAEWLSKNDLHVHIDEYVRLLSNWCEWNSCSRNFIKARSCLALGDTFKALDLLPLSLKGIYTERILKKFLRQDETKQLSSPYATLTDFYLKLIRLFESHGAHDGVLKLVHSGIDSTIQPKHQTMFQSIEFNCHIELGHYEEAYNTLTKNCEPARKKDCLRQLVCLLFSVRRLDILLELPYYGLEQEFTNIIGMNARSADIADCLQYNFLYSYHVNKMNLRKAAFVAYEEGMRNFLECSSLNHLNRHYGCILKCLNSLGVIKESYAWIVQPIIEIAELKKKSATEETVKIIDIKHLDEQLITTHCALQLSMNNDGFKLITSLEPTNLISLMLKCKLYNSALKLARSHVRSMIPTVYENLTNSCITASAFLNSLGTNTASNNSLAWLNDNCVSDVTVVSDSASTAWNYLRYLISQEELDVAADIHLAIVNRILSRCAYVPTWLKYWCFENIPVQFIRAYLCHGQLEEAYEHTIELFRSRFFSSGRFRQHTIFPVTMCDYLLYELEHSSNHEKEKDHIEQYLRIIEVAL